MKLRKRILTVALSCILPIFEFTNISAAETVQTTFSACNNVKANIEAIGNYSTIFNQALKKALNEGMAQTDITSTVTYEDDLVITQTEITYQPIFSVALASTAGIQSKSAGYKSEFSFHIYEVSSSKGKKLLRLDQSTEFEYNGSYAYVSDSEYVYYRYNDSRFVNRKSGYTSSSNKSSSLAKYWISGDIKWSTGKKSYTKHRIFTAQCTPKGAVSYTLKS